MKNFKSVLFCAIIGITPVLAVETPTMGWSSWNSFGHKISEDIIKSQADGILAKGLKEAGYIYINIDDGAWCGRDADGHLVIHPVRFPNGLKPLVDYIHENGLKAGTYSDAGYNTCASFWGGDTDGLGTGLYQHDVEDINFMFNELGFDFIKVDFCGGVPYHNADQLDLDERERYTAIAKAIEDTGRDDIRFNVCRWDYPGTWVEDVATSWRMSQDIYLGWASVKDIIHQNLYLSAYARNGRYNDMDMLEVGRGMSKEEDKTHFGMWCMMCSPLLIGCDVNEINDETLSLLCNPDLIALNQDNLGLQATVVKRENNAYILVKDLEELNGTKRAVAFYNPTDRSQSMKLNFKDVDLEGTVFIRDLFENTDLGNFENMFETEVPAHGTRIYALTADRRLERRLYEAETARIEAYQELDNNQVVISGIYEEMDKCSGGAKAGWLGNREDNFLCWENVYSNDGGEYMLSISYISGADRLMNIDVNGNNVVSESVNSGGWDKIDKYDFKVTLNKGNNTVKIHSSSDWLPDIDCMQVIPADEYNGIDTLTSADNRGDVYTVDGVCVARNLIYNEVEKLPSGTYIYNGKKILVK